MNRSICRFWRCQARIAALAIAVLLIGCSTSERDVAKHLDRTSEAIRQATQLIAADRELSRYPIVVDGFKGAMRLKGQVASPAQKLRAEKMVWAVQGVKSVENNLKVQGKP